MITTAEAATAHGVTQAAMRKAISLNGIEPVAYVDGRTPLYEPDALARALQSRPGRGANLRRAG